MALMAIGIGFFILLSLAYGAYGNYLARELALDDHKKTPAHLKNDGTDFVPTKLFYLFPQHFSAIAAAGPIAGPIMACMMWGFLPCLLWIALGVVLIGAVHDFLSLTASVRHGGDSIAQIAKENLGERAGLVMVSFIWLALAYVIVAFTDITAGSFVSATDELKATAVNFNPGGAVAAAASLYLFLSIIMGLVDRFFKPKLWINTIIFVPLTFVAVWLGTKYSTVLVFDAKTWCILILIYCFIASLLPVWLLLQPRGYLGGFILYTAIAVGIVGIIFGNFEIKQAAFKTFDSGGITGSLFPFLFVTIACGACSGFHGLVCSGTTAKQIDKESHIKAVGYGAMLGEALVAIIALATIMIFSHEEVAGLKPGTIYGKGLGQFMSVIIGKDYLPFAITFGAMAFSTFVFDTLDVSARLGRYLLQEVFKWHTQMGSLFCTLITLALPMFFVLLSESGSYGQFWSLFGASNQLLAALTLLSITVWLYKARRRIAFTLLPMLFVLSITGYALAELAFRNLMMRQSALHIVNGFIALSLIILAMCLVIKAGFIMYYDRRRFSEKMAETKA